MIRDQGARADHQVRTGRQHRAANDRIRGRETSGRRQGPNDGSQGLVPIETSVTHFLSSHQRSYEALTPVSLRSSVVFILLTQGAV